MNGHQVKISEEAFLRPYTNFYKVRLHLWRIIKKGLDLPRKVIDNNGSSAAKRNINFNIEFIKLR